QARDLFAGRVDVTARPVRDLGEDAAAADARDAGLDLRRAELRGGEEAPELGVVREREHDRQRRVAVAQVEATWLARHRRLPLDVEEVVAHLEREPDVPATRRHRLDERRRRAGEM